MISILTGTVEHIQDQKIIVRTNGIGFEITVPSPNTFIHQTHTTIYISFYWNQEQGPRLYGFSTHAEKIVFELILRCSGIGPKVGLAIIHQLGAPGFVQAIAQQDSKPLSSVSGIGSKKAEQIIMHLKDKLDSVLQLKEIMQDGSSIAHIHQVSEVLSSLNYSRTEIAAALNHLKEEKDQIPFDTLLRKALSFLSKLS